MLLDRWLSASSASSLLLIDVQGFDSPPRLITGEPHTKLAGAKAGRCAEWPRVYTSPLRGVVASSHYLPFLFQLFFKVWTCDFSGKNWQQSCAGQEGKAPVDTWGESPHHPPTAGGRTSGPSPPPQTEVGRQSPSHPRGGGALVGGEGGHAPTVSCRPLRHRPREVAPPHRGWTSVSHPTVGHRSVHRPPPRRGGGGRGVGKVDMGSTFSTPPFLFEL